MARTWCWGKSRVLWKQISDLRSTPAAHFGPAPRGEWEGWRPPGVTRTGILGAADDGGGLGGTSHTQGDPKGLFSRLEPSSAQVESSHQAPQPSQLCCLEPCPQLPTAQEPGSHGFLPISVTLCVETKPCGKKRVRKDIRGAKQES